MMIVVNVVIAKLRNRIFFLLHHSFLIVLSILLQNVLDLSDRNNREVFREKEVEREE